MRGGLRCFSGEGMLRKQTAFVAKEEADKKDRATREMLRSSEKLDAENVRMKQKAGGREDKVFTMFLHTLSL